MNLYVHEEVSAPEVTYTPANASIKTLTWRSDHPEEVSVDAATGKIKGEAVGTAVITAKATDGGYEASYTVNVLDPGNVVLQGISLDAATLELAVNEERKLTEIYKPTYATNRNVSWASSDSETVSVDAQGNVKALKSGGPVTITVTSEEKGYTAECKVTVKKSSGTVALAGITLEPATLELKVNATRKLEVKYTPKDATEKGVSWTSSDAAVVSVNDQGEVTAHQLGGPVTITATATDGGIRPRAR